MTNTDEITKDQEIQKLETIQSLNRKFESLEAELQKCLDLEGDSDTTRNDSTAAFAELSEEEKEILLKPDHIEGRGNNTGLLRLQGWP